MLSGFLANAILFLLRILNFLILGVILFDCGKATLGCPSRPFHNIKVERRFATLPLATYRLPLAPFPLTTCHPQKERVQRECQLS